MIWLCLALALGAEATEPTQVRLQRVMVEALGQDKMGLNAQAVAEALASLCDEGEALACEPAWATSLQTSVPGLQTACAEGEPLACLAAGWALSQTRPARFDAGAADPVEGVRLLGLACEAGVQRGCVDLGVCQQLGVGLPQDLAAGAVRFRSACDAGELSGCRRLGAAHQTGLGVARDFTKAAALYGEACEGGFVGGCNGQALLFHLGLGVEKDSLRALQLYRQACDDSFAPACMNLAPVLDGGLVDVPPEERLEALEWGCDTGHGGACVHLARTLTELQRPAEEAWKRGCALGLHMGCEGQAEAMLSGALPGGVEGALPLLAAGCEDGLGSACARLGALYLEGERVGRDRERAWSLNRTACDHEVGEACLAAAGQARKGRGAPKDKELAHQLMVRACALGAEEACESR